VRFRPGAPRVTGPTLPVRHRHLAPPARRPVGAAPRGGGSGGIEWWEAIFVRQGGSPGVPSLQSGGTLCPGFAGRLYGERRDGQLSPAAPMLGGRLAGRALTDL